MRHINDRLGCKLLAFVAVLVWAGAICAQVSRLTSSGGQIHERGKTLEGIWSNDFVVTNPFNKFVNKQQVVGMIESGTLAISSYDRQIEYVRVYRDIAVVAGSETVVWAGKMPNAGKTSNLRFTGIWMKQKGRWQEIARHANIVVPP